MTLRDRDEVIAAALAHVARVDKLPVNQTRRDAPMDGVIVRPPKPDDE
ncbi:MAG: hypothetical protein HQL38_11590 [Alphaproteobacteria bacterium]|nr:hypothetical protein [Alphaproteobacteria bacterium]MBF0335978.1 hypothetical protein [Alphaproteobacteria bacterium]MBF0374080.1 hypothetical protein [Alphaproteobacteria bacterium]MBF0393311.1 hypothetical protein [Alphaproteobacteria bacterium]